MFDAGDSNKYFAPSYHYIISPFDTLYRGQSTPIHPPPVRKFYRKPSLSVHHLSFLTKPHRSPQFACTKLTSLNYSLNAADSIRNGILFLQSRSFTIHRPRAKDRSLLIILDRSRLRVYPIPNDSWRKYGPRFTRSIIK